MMVICQRILRGIDRLRKVCIENISWLLDHSKINVDWIHIFWRKNWTENDTLTYFLISLALPIIYFFLFHLLNFFYLLFNIFIFLLIECLSSSLKFTFDKCNIQASCNLQWSIWIRNTFSKLSNHLFWTYFLIYNHLTAKMVTDVLQIG